MKHFRIGIGASALLLVSTLACCQMTAVEAEVSALSSDIELLQQLNSVNLTPDQLKALAAIVERRVALRQSLNPKREQVLSALSQALRQKRQLLLADQPVPDDLDERIARLNTELNALDQSERAQAEALAKELRKLLSPMQLAVLTGREEAKQSALEMLQWLRRLKDAQYQEEAQAAAEELDSPERGLPASQIKKIFDTARAMPEDTFVEKAAELAQKLLPAYALSESAETQVIIDFISHPRMPSLLQDKLAVTKG
ncbi:MAG: hypothetical protein H5T86_12105 [Armatimonadetes bacterium]|nr:hypothetical protein [Armatimonadota bacterium]